MASEPPRTRDPAALHRETGSRVATVTRRRVVRLAAGGAAVLAVQPLAGRFTAAQPAPLAALFRTPAALAADQSPLMGLLVTLAATAEDLEPVGAPNTGGIQVSCWLNNQTGQETGDVRLQAPVPAKTLVTELRQGFPPSAAPGAAKLILDGQTITWQGFGLARGEQAGPFTYRLVPANGADGAIVFRGATVQPQVSWTQPAAGKAQPPTLRLNGLWGTGGLRRTVLPSLLTVFTRERPDTASAALALGVRAGSRDEDDTTWGGSHWLEHAHFLGTATRPDDQALFGPIATVGGDSNASTSNEYTDYYHLVPADNFDLALDVLSDQILNSTFPREAFDRERRVVFEELKRNVDTPSRRVSDEFYRLVFQVSPLRRDAGGYVETVATIPIETILAYRAQRYISGDMAIAAVGNLRHDETVARIEKAFAALPRGAQLERKRVPEPVQTAPRALEIGTGTDLADLQMGWPVPGDDAPDSPALTVLGEILGTTGRRLQEDIRDKRALASAISASYDVWSDAGALSVSATTDGAKLDEVVDAVLQHIRRLRDGAVSDADVQTSIRAVAGRRALSEEPNLAQAVGLAAIEVSGVLDSSDEFVARLRPVTPVDVQRVAQAYLDPANYTKVVVHS